ncbi:hypothetical protein A3B35_00720 [Candidatus Kaiserbacteria bacterium RIFCSPLOWO2_01_FULL_54_24]|uniref:Transcription regulator TrmB N-terminal domain-containing protein n=1 Tax=Candidatus Kaiserbacteria bacterium RIFCSPLOWO2_01_FULL_54_24 TaxID=1798515 RepID=A0A1F6ET42_9BACT|nr:MAG: hypothetical protein A3B35_00720 [Candidatus Kaiserbacteria bacterium RIFCSPLOWO2_01_FULL_54_24]
MKKELVALGFEEKEADIYLACIANERSTPTELAQKTKLKRATVYFYLEKLRGKGLITSEVRGARRYASATSLKPALTQLLQSKKENIDREKDILRSLLSKLGSVRPKNGSSSRVYVLEGEEGARFAVQKILEKKQNVYWLGSFETLLGVLSERNLHRLLTVPRLKQGTISYAMTDKRILKYPQFSNVIGNKRLYRFLEKDFDTPGVLGLFGDTICLLAKDGGKIRVVLIEDQLMHDTVKFLFTHMWAHA